VHQSKEKSGLQLWCFSGHDSDDSQRELALLLDYFTPLNKHLSILENVGSVSLPSWRPQMVSVPRSARFGISAQDSMATSPTLYIGNVAASMSSLPERGLNGTNRSQTTF
jgi:hypothetical protein